LFFFFSASNKFKSIIWNNAHKESTDIKFVAIVPNRPKYGNVGVIFTQVGKNVYFKNGIITRERVYRRR
jgi:uncharacterized protein (UPF0333 family)